MKILILISRLVGSFLILKFAYGAYSVIENYSKDVFFAKSAVQASQLSGEQLLISASNTAAIIAVGILMIVVEFIYLSGMVREHIEPTKAYTDINTNTEIEVPDK